MKPTFEIFVADGTELTEAVGNAMAAAALPEFERALAERNDDGVSPIEVSGPVPGFSGCTWKFTRGTAA